MLILDCYYETASSPSLPYSRKGLLGCLHWYFLKDGVMDVRREEVNLIKV